MLQHPWRGCWCLALLGLAGAALAQTSAGDAAERERIVRERAAAEARFQAARSDCEARFASTACLNAARAERRGAMEGLKREEVVLDTALRRQRAADRMRRIQDKVREADARPPASALPVTPGHGPIEKKVRKPARAHAPPGRCRRRRVIGACTPGGREDGRPRPATKPAPRPAAKAKAPSGTPPDDAARRAARRAAYERRQADAQARREAVAQRNAARAAKAKPAAPLPPRPGVPVP